MWKNSSLRTLSILYVLVILAGLFEYLGTPTKKRPEPDIYGGPRRNFPEAMAHLYPGSSEAEYLLGRRFEARAGNGYNREEVVRNPALLKQFLQDVQADLTQAARHYERAMQLGLISEENLYYNYALTLIRLREDPAKIDRAIATWKRNFPFSDRRDLTERRQTIEEQLRQVPVVSSIPGPNTNRVSSQGNTSAQGAASEPQSQQDTDQVEAALQVTPQWKAVAGYVGSEACRKCHPDQFDTYLATAHSRALAEVDPASEPPDAQFDHAASVRRYRVTRHDGKLVHAESLPLDDGSEFLLTSTPVRYRVGSGHFARTYLTDAGGGFLFESPVTWYEPARKWGMTPGFDRPGHRSFSRPILEHCLWCHSGQAQTSTESDFRLHLVENSIGCERCHGPGERHVQSQLNSKEASNAPDDTIVNPRRLSRKLAEGICQQCHLQSDIQIGGSKLRLTDYRPGQPLEKYSTAYRLRSTETGMTVVGHVEQLAASACYRKSETLTCVTCHNPHRAVPAAERVASFRQACLECHADQGCRLPAQTREERASNDCTQCHMPKAATEVPHLAFTHHHIGIHPLQPPANGTSQDAIIPLSDLSSLPATEQTRSLMLARMHFYLLRGPGFQTSAAGQRFRREIEDWMQSLPAEEVDSEIEFARIQFTLAKGNVAEAVESALRTLKRSDLRSEEAAALLEQLAQINIDQNNWDVARSYLGKLVNLRRQGRDWFSLGLLEEKVGRLTAAEQALQQARHLEPATVEILEALRKVYQARQSPADERRIEEDISRLKRRLTPESALRPKLP